MNYHQESTTRSQLERDAIMVLAKHQSGKELSREEWRTILRWMRKTNPYMNMKLAKQLVKETSPKKN